MEDVVAYNSKVDQARRLAYEVMRRESRYVEVIRYHEMVRYRLPYDGIVEESVRLEKPLVLQKTGLQYDIQRYYDDDYPKQYVPVLQYRIETNPFLAWMLRLMVVLLTAASGRLIIAIIFVQLHLDHQKNEVPRIYNLHVT